MCQWPQRLNRSIGVGMRGLMRFFTRDNESGFSLVEAMIVVGVLGIATLGLTTVMVNMNQQMSFASAKTDSVYLAMQAENALRGSSGCYGNMTANSVVIGSSETLNNLRLYNSGGAVVGDLVPALNTDLPGGSKLQVSSMRLTAPSDATAAPVLISTTATSRNYAADLIIDVTHGTGSTMIKPLRVGVLNLQTNLAGVVSSCKVGTSLVCATGSRNGSTSTDTLEYADPGFTGNFATAFTVVLTAGRWGVYCNPGWNLTGCRGSELAFSSASTDPTVRTFSNGCDSPNSSIVPTMNSKLHVTCCTSP